jgi:hypothetical protein
MAVILFGKERRPYKVPEPTVHKVPSTYTKINLPILYPMQMRLNSHVSPFPYFLFFSELLLLSVKIENV